MTLRSFTVFAHRWLGLISSIVIIIAGLTGVLLVWPLWPGWSTPLAHFHVDLALGPVGAWIVLVLTWVSVALILSGLYLWWKTKVFRVRTKSGWKAFVLDLHYSAGAIFLLIMLLIATTGALRAHVTHPRARQIISRLHTTARFPQPVKVVYAIGSFAFVVEGVTGVLMWVNKQPWRKRRRPLR